MLSTYRCPDPDQHIFFTTPLQIMFNPVQADGPQHLHHPVRCVLGVLCRGDGAADAGPGPRHVHPGRHRCLKESVHDITNN